MSLRNWIIRTDPSASTTSAPNAAAASNATARGSRPDAVTKLTFTDRRFWKTNNKITANRIRAGSTRSQIREARVEGIAVAPGAADAVVAWSPAAVGPSGTTDGAGTPSVDDSGSRAPMKPQSSPCGGVLELPTAYPSMPRCPYGQPASEERDRPTNKIRGVPRFRAPENPGQSNSVWSVPPGRPGAMPLGLLAGDMLRMLVPFDLHRYQREVVLLPAATFGAGSCPPIGTLDVQAPGMPAGGATGTGIFGNLLKHTKTWWPCPNTGTNLSPLT